jgi:hypothetical protein
MNTSRCLVVTALLLVAPAVQSASFWVTNPNDSGPGSLRRAIEDAAAAAGPDTIQFTFSRTITLGSEIVVSDPDRVSIDGSGLSSGVTIDGGAGMNRLFTVAAGATLHLRNLTLTGGNGGGASQPNFGGAILNRGTLVVEDTTICDNLLDTTSGQGGGIYSHGSLTVTRCTFTGNTAYEGGGVRSQFTACTITNSTFTGNSATIGGGLSIADGGPAALLTHLTIVGNSARGNPSGPFGGGGIFLFDKATTLANCIVARNTSPTGPDIHNSNSSPVTSGGGNLIGDSTGLTWTPLATDRAGTAIAPIDPRLAPLASNGGLTQTMAPLCGSPALNAALFIAGLLTDQRGLPRSAGGAPDIGAYEAQAAQFSVGFNFVGGGPAGTTGTLAAGDRAGAPGFVQANWNNLSFDYDGNSSGSAPNAASRRDATGASLAGLRLWWDAPNTWGQPSASLDTADKKLMGGYLDSNASGDGSGAVNLYKQRASQRPAVLCPRRLDRQQPRREPLQCRRRVLAHPDAVQPRQREFLRHARLCPRHGHCGHRPEHAVGQLPCL